MSPKEQAATTQEPLRFAWDRSESSESLRSKLADASADQWLELAAWILREARVDEVWTFIEPKQIAGHFDELAPRLGRRRALWTYLMRTWRELGKL